MSESGTENPPTGAANPAERFKKWLQLLEAHGMQRREQPEPAGRSGSMPKPTCLHGQPWDECRECP